MIGGIPPAHGAMRIVQPEPEVPQSYDDVFKQLEIKQKIDIVTKQAQQNKKRTNQAAYSKQQNSGIEQHHDEDYDYDDDYYDDYYGFEDPEDPANAMKQILMNPDELKNVLSGMVTNPMVQAQFNPNQLGMLMDPNQLSGLSSLLSGISTQAMMGGSVPTGINFPS